MGKDSIQRPKIVILSGAGISADSGIATYRGSGGVYEGIAAEDIMSAKTMRDNPAFIHRFCDARRVELANAEPNPAHAMIAALAERYGDQLVHLTQNVDDLCERAGFGGSHHLHGELRRMRSVGNSKVEVDIGFKRYWEGSPEEMPDAGYQFRCPMTGSLFRPGVVLFGEAAPLYAKLYSTMRRLRRDDILLVMGTAGEVLPVEFFASVAPCKKLLNNLHDSDDIDSDRFHWYIKAPAAQAADEIMDIVTRHMDEWAAR